MLCRVERAFNLLGIEDFIVGLTNNPADMTPSGLARPLFGSFGSIIEHGANHKMGTCEYPARLRVIHTKDHRQAVLYSR